MRQLAKISPGVNFLLTIQLTGFGCKLKMMTTSHLIKKYYLKPTVEVSSAFLNSKGVALNYCNQSRPVFAQNAFDKRCV